MDTIDRIFELVDAKFNEQKEFAAAVGVSEDTASDWRRKKSESCTKPKYLTKIAEVLGTTTEYLLTGKKAESVSSDAFSEEELHILRQIHDRPGMRVMFSLTSKATDEDVKKATEIIRAFLGAPEDES